MPASEASTELKPEGAKRLGKAERDIVALGIAIAAIIMFVGTGSTVVPSIIRSIAGLGGGPESLLTNALLLNIALIVFGWRRYRELTEEVRERRKAEEQARQLAETDPLTGCLNRRSIGPETDRLLEGCASRGEAIAFMMIDVDNFKQINDCNGHIVGDAILLECARRIGALLPDRSLMARLGGDEFACVVPFHPQQGERIDQLAGSIIATVAAPVPVNGASTDIETTVSVGISRSDICSKSNEERSAGMALLHCADVAMYHAKKNGRNRYCWFEAPMESELRFRAELEAGIRQGLQRGEFIPYYEQQIDLSTGDLVGFEMLARWRSPTLGLVSPEVFIPVAEEMNLIADLSESVIRQALEDAKTWDPKLTLSVNISPLQLRDPWFAQKLLKLLVEANFPPSRLDIEITESCLHENLGLVRSLITSLKNQGIQVSLDDFGTGYSSLAQLRSLPFSRIKIDRSFVTNLSENKESETIVQAITSLGEGLGMPITAEGIETREVLERLRTFGDYKGQGYFYGRPADARDTQAFLATLHLLIGDNPVAAEPGADEASLRRA